MKWRRYVRVVRAFSRGECLAIIALAKRFQDESDAHLGRAIEVSVPRTPGWLLGRAEQLLLATNPWRLALDGMRQRPSIIRYRHGHWIRMHVDYKAHIGDWSKLTAIVLLSEPRDFDGGGLRITEEGRPVAMNRGDAVVFPSFHLHGVVPVTRGERIIMAAWAVGPPLV
jgi:PKHD-type hydroxylase